MNWILVGEIVYLALLVIVCMRIVYDTRSTTKTLAYLLLAVFLPIVGAVFYFSFGINYRKRQLYSKKLLEDEDLQARVKAYFLSSSEKIWAGADAGIQENRELSSYLLRDNMSPVMEGNRVSLLVNGEQKFPEVLQAMEQARHHIHVEYYIMEDDEIGNTIKEMLIRKAGEGVKVRFIYDDFGCRPIRRRIVPELRKAGVEACPFNRVLFWALANRLNYRNHRKIIVVDGRIGFTGGINISDRYINNQPGKLYWRDTHLRIEGPGVFYLQYLFLCDWHFASGKKLKLEQSLFGQPFSPVGNTIVQIAASGPDSVAPTILYSLLQAIGLARKEILITTPYFIPGESLQDALVVAAMSGLSVKLIVPGKSDSKLVNAAAKSYYDDLLMAGAEIYLYKKGFVHAKTMVTDTNVSVIGTANMDYRSSELNFEVNALVYDVEIADQMREMFYRDLLDCEPLDKHRWLQRPWYRQVMEKTARLLSPLL